MLPFQALFWNNLWILGRYVPSIHLSEPPKTDVSHTVTLDIKSRGAEVISTQVVVRLQSPWEKTCPTMWPQLRPSSRGCPPLWRDTSQLWVKRQHRWLLSGAALSCVHNAYLPLILCLVFRSNMQQTCASYLTTKRSSPTGHPEPVEREEGPWVGPLAARDVGPGAVASQRTSARIDVEISYLFRHLLLVTCFNHCDSYLH